MQFCRDRIHLHVLDSGLYIQRFVSFWFLQSTAFGISLQGNSARIFHVFASLHTMFEDTGSS